MNKNIKIILGLIVAVLVVWGIYSITQKPNELTENEPIKIGAILPLTGDAAIYGQAAQKAINLAIEKIENESGLKLNVIFEDSQMVPQKAITSLQKLINLDNIKYVIGISSGEILAMCPITESKKIILLSLATSPEVTKCGEYTFRNLPSDVYQGKILAEKVYDRGYKNISLIYINSDYGVGLKNEFEKNFKGNIVSIESHKLGDFDFRTQLTKIKSMNPEAIVVLSQLPEANNLLKQRAELNIIAPVFGSEGLKNDNLLKDVSSNMLKDTYVVFVSQYAGAEFQEFKNTYSQKYGEDFGPFTDYVYDNVLVLADAIKKCQVDNDAECVKSNLYKTDIVGATGRIQFDENGDILNKPYSLYKVENNEFVEIK